MLIELDIAQTVGVAAVFLVIGELIKRNVPILERYFIPSPIIGGLVFSLITLYGYQTQSFSIELYDNMRAFLLMAFFTTIGFSASFEMLKKGGVAVAIFLFTAVLLLSIQNLVGVSLASLMGESPLLGLIAGSITLTGGHGTAAAFAPLLEQKGVVGAMPAAIAAATWGLVAGCVIGGPLGSRLMKRHHLKGRPFTSTHPAHDLEPDPVTVSSDPTVHTNSKPLLPISLYSVVLLTVSMGLGASIIDWLQDSGITLPGYLGAMVIAAIIRNVIDWKGFRFPEQEFDIIGSISLGFFLVMALMSMKLWELADVAGPLLVILVAQTALMFFFAMFVTFRLMGKDYDAAVIATGHCGFGMGATPNAMANMQSFTAVNGPSPKAFFVIPLVGSLFIDFFNAVIITVFMSIFS
ncbi:sodium/glutamate symporter [Paenalcaligenes hominis]|uniref:Sodium/glutamate symporter n=1 Tax=Paenalcaligenes hominis TaxID=643674 RepID=A0A1U9JZZ9_9BURK|nr:sodium/glutamate symporter [Paenalcaligenes hominis]AQS51356.1 sodium/glutamate symporter [Paenalcaligenes hominis]